MRFERDEYRVYLPVTELASYAYQRENVRLLMDKYHFVRESASDPAVLQEELPSADDD